MRDVALSIDINHPRCGLSKFLRSKNMREEIINCELNLEYICRCETLIAHLFTRERRSNADRRKLLRVTMPRVERS